MADYKKVSGSKVSFELTLNEEDFKKAQSHVLAEAKKTVSLKGFRKGHAPNSAVMSAMGMENFMMEAFNTALNKYYKDFIIKNKLAPVGQPEIDFGGKIEMPAKVKVVVEVYPEIELGDYKKIKMSPVKVDIKDAEIDDVIETLIVEAKAAKKVERAAKKKDVVIATFFGKDKDGKELPNTRIEKTDFRIGMGHFLPDLEAGIEGMKAGEKKEKVTVKFPKDYHAKDMAGATTYFEVEVFEVQSVSAKDIDESIIEKVTGKKKSVAEFKEDIKGLIKGNKEQNEKKKSIEEYKKSLAKKAKVELPESWVEREADMRLRQMKASPQFQANPDKFWENVGKKEDELLNQFKEESAEGLKTFLCLSEVVKLENIELDKDEQASIHQQVHAEIDKNPNALAGSHDQMLESGMLNRKIDKFLNSLFV